MDGAERRRSELAAFLRSRRERRRPEDAGMPDGRRRTPGLRREEVATLAGVSITWYTWLEQGRDIRASDQVLGSLAGALGLDAVETEHLFQLAGVVAPARAGQPSPVAPQYRTLLDQLDPSPAFISNRRFDVLAWNRGHTVLYGDFAAKPVEDRNMLWLAFADDRFRELAVDWEAEAAYAVALFRSQAGELLTRPELAELLDRLCAASADFRRLWERRDLTAFSPRSHGFRHPELGLLELDYLKLYGADDGKTVVAHLLPPGSDVERRFTEAVTALG